VANVVVTVYLLMLASADLPAEIPNVQMFPSLANWTLPSSMLSVQVSNALAEIPRSMVFV
jgi:hypothetical protein